MLFGTCPNHQYMLCRFFELSAGTLVIYYLWFLSLIEVFNQTQIAHVICLAFLNIIYENSNGGEFSLFQDGEDAV